MRDVLARGAESRRIERLLAAFCPDVVISDTEALVLRATKRIGAPSIGLDHVGVMAHCRPPVSGFDRAQLALEAAVYRLLLGDPDRVIVSSFYDAPPRHGCVRRVPAILRERVARAAPRDGDHLLVYFNKGNQLYTPRVHEALVAAEIPAVVYGAGRTGQDRNVILRPIDEVVRGGPPSSAEPVSSRA